MADAHKNFATSLVATAPSPATSGTSLVVTGGDGAKFPNPPFNATIWPVGVQPTTANAEIVRVTAISTDTFTIVRQQESTSARTVIIGDQISANITARTLTDAEKPLVGVTGGTLAASTDYVALDNLEIAATDTFEIPATSTVEIEPVINPLVGEIKMFGGSQIPAGWFLCDGSTVSRTTYSGLFRVIGTVFGVGDGSTTFTLPDFRQKFPMGVAASGTGNALGATGGSIDHTHALSDSAYAQIAVFNSGGNSFADARTIAVTSFTSSDRVTSAGTTSGVASTKGVPLRGATDATNPPFLVVNFIIRY